MVVEPGIGWIELNEYLEPYGLFFPLDPGWFIFIADQSLLSFPCCLCFFHSDMQHFYCLIKNTSELGSRLQVRGRSILNFRFSCTSKLCRTWCNHWGHVCYTLLGFVSCQVVVLIFLFIYIYIFFETLHYFYSLSVLVACYFTFR